MVVTKNNNNDSECNTSRSQRLNKWTSDMQKETRKALSNTLIVFYFISLFLTLFNTIRPGKNQLLFVENLKKSTPLASSDSVISRAFCPPAVQLYQIELMQKKTQNFSFFLLKRRSKKRQEFKRNQIKLDRMNNR